MHSAEPAHTGERWWRPTFSAAGLEWGVASLEQSVAGAWFRSLPMPDLVSGPESGRDARWCLEQLIALRPDVDVTELVVSTNNGAIHISGHDIAEHSDPSKIVIELCRGDGGSGSVPPSLADSSLLQQSSGTRDESRSWGQVNMDHSPARAPALAPTSDPQSLGGIFFTPLREHLSQDRACSPGGAMGGGALSLGLGHALPHALGHGLMEAVLAPTAPLSGCPLSSATDEARGEIESHDVDLGSEPPLQLPLGGRVERLSQTIHVHDRIPNTRAPPEVILYVPGFNAALKDEISCVGQLLCLGDFPPQVKAFLFSWPGGRELTYFTAINYAKHPRCQADFAAFVASFIDAGVREFHVICHSVGAHVFLSALHLITPMLQTCEQQAYRCTAPGRLHGAANPAEDMPRARFASVMIMSPDYPLRKFVSRDFSMLRRLCSTITLYCDVADRALFYSETFNRELALGKNPFRIVRSSATGDRGGGAHTASKHCHRTQCSNSVPRDGVRESVRRASSGLGGHDSEASCTADSAPAPTEFVPMTAEARSSWPRRRSVLSWVASLGEYSVGAVAGSVTGSVAMISRTYESTLNGDLSSQQVLDEGQMRAQQPQLSPALTLDLV